jgi:hypothetical protein
MTLSSKCLIEISTLLLLPTLTRCVDYSFWWVVCVRLLGGLDRVCATTVAYYPGCATTRAWVCDYYGVR